MLPHPVCDAQPGLVRVGLIRSTCCVLVCVCVCVCQFGGNICIERFALLVEFLATRSHNLHDIRINALNLASHNGAPRIHVDLILLN